MLSFEEFKQQETPKNRSLKSYESFVNVSKKHGLGNSTSVLETVERLLVIFKGPEYADHPYRDELQRTIEMRIKELSGQKEEN